MKRCIELARKAQGNTYPNPLVGAVIVHEGKIIGEGYHNKAGEPHAEINAINFVSDKSLLPQSTIYVSLEPCAHFGRTPPCALKLKEIGFKKVVIGTSDPFAKVNGKGIQILQDAGIEVETGILTEECNALNRRFFTFHEKKRPYIILKWAQSADGFLDKNFQPVQISNEITAQTVHQMRNDEQAILVGTRTALRDNPSLTTRNISGRNPVRIVIDFYLKVPADHRIYNEEAETIVINSAKHSEEGHIRYRKARGDSFMADLMKIMYEENIQSVLVEGGAATLETFIRANTWDEAVIITNTDLKLQAGTLAPILTEKLVRTAHIRNDQLQFFKNIDSV